MNLPSTDLLKEHEESIDDTEQKETVETLKKFFKTHNKKVKIEGFEKGPTVSKYHISPYGETTYNEIEELNYDIAMAVESKVGNVYIRPPVADYFNIVIPNKKRNTVTLRTLLESEAYKQETSKSTTPIGISTYSSESADQIEIIDFVQVPHLLIAGASNSGKSIFLHSVINSLMFRNTPQYLKFILFDPKRVEFSVYEDMPHLVTPVFSDILAVPKVFEWLVGEMDRRYGLFVESRVRNIDQYNESNPEEPIYRIILIVDEFSDCIIADPQKIEKHIVRLSRLARAAGIHMILSTSMPSNDVYTGAMKENIPFFVLFRMKNSTDFGSIFDQYDAERLMGAGDMLFVPPYPASPSRIQAPNISFEEINSVVDFLKSRGSSEYDFDL